MCFCEFNPGCDDQGGDASRAFRVYTPGWTCDKSAVSRREWIQNQVKAEAALREAQSPYKAAVWRELTPRERLRRVWAMRSRLPDPRAVHDRKLFPSP